MRKNVFIFGHNDATQFIDIYNQYTKLFPPREYQVTVGILTGKNNLATRKRLIAEEVIFFDLPKTKIKMLKIAAVKKLYQFCKMKKFSYVICHRYKPSYIMLWVAQFCAIDRLFFVMHELHTLQSWGRKLIVALLLRKNMLLAGVSAAVRDDMRRSLIFVDKAKVQTLYNMIDIDATLPQFLTRAAARAALQLKDEDFVFGTIGRLVPNKDQITLINAFHQLKATSANAKLIIIGDGELELPLKAHVHDLNMTQRIIFTGFLPQAWRYLRAFDCFVLPSIQEAFGRVLLEAMLAGCPIIAAKVNGIPEVVGDTAALVPAKDVAVLAQKMGEVAQLAEDERAILASRACERVKDDFSIPQFVEHFWQLAKA